MGDRKYPELKTYFDNIRATMSSVAALANRHTVFVQMVAFSEPRWQLKRYLETMKEAGLVEIFLPVLKGKADGRLWRSVPGRRWYSDSGTTRIRIVQFMEKVEAAVMRPHQLYDRGSTVPVIRERLSTSGRRKGAMALVASATMSRTSGRFR